jgi:hypothetical protein
MLQQAVSFAHLYEDTKAISEETRKDVFKPEITNGVALLMNTGKQGEDLGCIL